MDFKHCSACKANKPLTDFHKNKAKQDGRQNQCKECHAQSRKDSYSRYRETRIKNQVQYNKNKYHSDETYRLSCIIRSRMKIALTKDKKVKKYPTFKYIGCSIYYLQLWLEFTKRYYAPEDYTGEFHLDHFYPLDSFNLSNEEELYEACNWQNLRYIPARDNLVKSNKLPSRKERKEYRRLKKYFIQIDF